MGIKSAMGAFVTARRLQLAAFAVLVVVATVAYQGGCTCPVPPLPTWRGEHPHRSELSILSCPCADVSRKWSGQFEQDRWVALDVYSSMRNGYFVELGASDGLTYSNTVDLERHYGWRGLCIEGAPHKFAKLQANRPLCANRYAAVTADDTTVVH